MNANHPSDDRLIAFSLDELDPDRCDEIADHLAECETCAGTVAALGRVLDGYRDEAAPPPPSETLLRLLEEQAVHAEKRRSLLSGLNPFRLVPALALFTILFLAGFVAGRGSLFPPRSGDLASTSATAPFAAPPDAGAVLFHAATSEATLSGGALPAPRSTGSGRDSL